MKTMRIILITGVLLLSILACRIPGLSNNSSEGETTPVIQTEAVPEMTVVPPSAEPAALPTETPGQPTEAALPVDVVCEAIAEFEICVPKSLASALVVSTIPGVNNPDGAPWENIPEHYVIRLDGYPLHDTFHQPVINLIPLEAFREISVGAQVMSDELAPLLEAKPNPPSQLPFLPLMNAGPVIVTRSSYPETESVMGIATLTQFAQYFAPINNNELFYTFQGETTDGKYWISIVLPMSQESLPPNAQAVANALTDEFAENYQTYVEEVGKTMTDAPADSFVPNLLEVESVVGMIRYTP